MVMGTPVQSSVTDTPPSSGTPGTSPTEPEAESGTSSRALATLPKNAEASQAALQVLVDSLRSTGLGITITGEGRIITFPMASESVVDKLEIVEGTSAWHYHNNPLYSDCVLEIEGLPRMHASAGEAHMMCFD
jgi:hypothetical protein